MSGSVTPSSNGLISSLRTRLSGDLGSLPAVLGFIFLTLLFSVLRPDTFATVRNAANLLVQAAPVIFIGMGLIFVLLIAEIDLSAGFTAGVAAAAAAALMTRMHVPWPLAVLASLVVGAGIGLGVGVLVARLKIPSFVVTLSGFLALQGVLLLVIGDGGTIGVTDPVILALMNDTLPPILGWVLCLLLVGLDIWGVLSRASARRRAGLSVGQAGLVLRILALAAPLVAATFLLNLERAINPNISSLRGVPLVVPFTAVFMLGLSLLLGRTAFGRHIYAVGGNAEAARRAGINVEAIRMACFVLCSTMASIGGLLLVSYNNSVSPTTGGSSTLLYSVGAVVIGGASLFGGKGRPGDAVLGGMVVAVIANGLPLITQQSGIQFIVTGLVLLVAAAIDALARRGR
ncbi:MAG: transporter permease [Caulobacteraceae bacterium]|nr:transporter permease [Caulobacteraceae bacterium]